MFIDVIHTIMRLFIKYDMPTACKIILQEQLDKLKLDYSLDGFNEVEVNEPVSGDKLIHMNTYLNNYGIEILDNPKSILIQKIKDAIIEMVYMEKKLPIFKISTFLAEKVDHSYGYISALFSDVTYTSIENFIIIQKIERAKQLIIMDDLTITEIAWELNYSSVAHFCTQFKNITGLTPTTFHRIINKRRNALMDGSIKNTKSEVDFK